MKILAIIKSKHKKNTLKIAEAMAEVSPITVCDVNEAENYDLMQYDIIGFGSGITAGKFSNEVFKFIVRHIKDLSNVFVFSTSAKGKIEYNSELETYLNNNCKNVLGSFACKGYCNWFIFALIGGISKGHPDEADTDNAKSFIKQVLAKYDSCNI